MNNTRAVLALICNSSRKQRRGCRWFRWVEDSISPHSSSRDGPYWFHRHGREMVPSLNFPSRTLVIENRHGACVRIRRLFNSVFSDDPEPDAWEVETCLTSADNITVASWRGVMTGTEVYHAFTGTRGQAHGVRKYYRENRHLSLPVMGSGMKGDPNTSIFITDEIARMVSRLVG